MIAAKETIYNGYRFRSRLEARWAVFFDTLGIQYEYEKETFELSNGRAYLPDFWLPQVYMWAEIKPEALTPEEEMKCRLLAKGTVYPCLRLIGPPAVRAYESVWWHPTEGDYAHEWWWLVTWKFHRCRFFYTYEEHGVPDERLREDANYTRAIEAAQQARFEWGESGAPKRLLTPLSIVPKYPQLATPLDNEARCKTCRTLLVQPESQAIEMCSLCVQRAERAAQEAISGPPAWRAGEKARHPKFGEGIVVQYKADADEITIAFPDPPSIKRMLVKRAHLVHVS